MSDKYIFGGTIQVPHDSIFSFETIAPTPLKARANGISQFARAKNLSIMSMQAEVKRLGEAFQITVKKLSEKPFLTRDEMRRAAAVHSSVPRPITVSMSGPSSPNLSNPYRQSHATPAH